MNMPLDDSGKPVEGLYYPTPVTPEEAFQAIGRLRKEARDEIDRLIRFLDETDNHMEREQDGDELDASYPESGSRLCTPGEDDEEDDHGEDDSTGEWSLGFLELHPSIYSMGRDSTGCQDYGYLCAGVHRDLEDEHDGGEPDQEGEPSLGWTTSGVLGGLNDRELDNCDREVNEPLLTECT